MELVFLLKWCGGVVGNYARPTILRSLVRTPARTIPRISQLEIHSVYQAVIGTGFTWQCGGIAQFGRAADFIYTCQCKLGVTGSIPVIGQLHCNNSAVGTTEVK